MKNKNIYLLIITGVLAAVIIYFTMHKNVADNDNDLGLVDTTMQLPLTPDEKPADKNALLMQLATDVVHALHDSNYKKLSSYIHPVNGVRFSPVTFVDTITDVQLKQKDFLNLLQSNTKILWGFQDASGDSILLTLQDYIRQYIYEVDFLHAPKTDINHFIGFSTNLNNIKEIYPGDDFVEFHFPGFEKKYEGLDWRSLRIVVSLYDGKYFLVGVVHDQWST